MDTYDAINNRRTIRDFSPRPVEPELIQKMITAGFKAPSNNHLREWHFVLLQDLDKRKELLDQIIKPISRKGAVAIINRWKMTDPIQREMYLDAIPKQYSMLFNCACLMIPFFRQTNPLQKPKNLSDLNAFASIWACIENILVAGAAEGVLGVMRIPFDNETQVIKTFLNIPEGYEMPCYLALGYPAENAARATQVEIPIQERIHLDTW